MALETTEEPGRHADPPPSAPRRGRPARVDAPARPVADNMTRPWVLAELNYGTIKSQPPFELAVLPFGATEPHNLHLPYGTDTYQVEELADRACALAHERGARVVRLPALAYGTETNQMRFPLAMNLNPSTVARVITDLVQSLAVHGIRKCLLLNGHGGNDLKWVLRELHTTTPVHLFLCNWYKVAGDRYMTIFEKADDHAGEMETSLMMAIQPGLVAFEQADAGSTAATRFESVNRGWVEITRPWHLLTTNSGAGDPRAATAAKGEALAAVVVERLALALEEIARCPVDESFPYGPDTRRPADRA
jgi:creatinine amidohydrolase